MAPREPGIQAHPSGSSAVQRPLSIINRSGTAPASFGGAAVLPQNRTSCQLRSGLKRVGNSSLAVGKSQIRANFFLFSNLRCLELRHGSRLTTVATVDAVAGASAATATVARLVASCRHASSMRNAKRRVVGFEIEN